jgi:zinc/manganese transport system substrate-binding protein
MMKEAGGDHVSVKTLVGLNRDVHEFEPSPDDANTLTVADIAFVSGEGLER